MREAETWKCLRLLYYFSKNSVNINKRLSRYNTFFGGWEVEYWV